MEIALFRPKCRDSLLVRLVSARKQSVVSSRRMVWLECIYYSLSTPQSQSPTEWDRLAGRRYIFPSLGSGVIVTWLDSRWLWSADCSGWRPQGRQGPLVRAAVGLCDTTKNTSAALPCFPLFVIIQLMKHPAVTKSRRTTRCGGRPVTNTLELVPKWTKFKNQFCCE